MWKDGATQEHCSTSARGSEAAANAAYSRSPSARLTRRTVRRAPGIWSLRVENGRAVELRKESSRIGQLSSFGEGADGALYAVSVGSGRLFRVVG